LKFQLNSTFKSDTTVESMNIVVGNLR